MQTVSFYLASLVLGAGFLPVTSGLFRTFRDRGWLFSRAVGLFLAGWVFWILNTAHLCVFSQRNILIVCVCLFAANAVLVVLMGKRRRRGAASAPAGDPEAGRYAAEEAGAPPADWKKILLEEILFLAVFLVMLRLIGFRPEAYDTEKFMDLGFLTSIRRSAYMPFSDLWFAGKPVNYYYGGQYFSAFLIRLAGVTDGAGYNLMRALITSATFCFPFSIVSELLGRRKARSLPLLGGVLAGLAAAFCGNGHYLIYGILRPLAGAISGTPAAESYWFPDSTRFIGYVPEGNDKTIHEFPSYSSILGDLHAHYINLIFVLLLIALLVAWAMRTAERNERRALAESADGTRREAGAAGLLRGVLSFLADGRLLLIALVTGVFRWTNFWDFPIYLVVTGAVLLFVCLKYERSRLRALLFTAAALAAIVLAGKAAVIPFTSSFDMISSEIARTFSHSPLWQFLILWAAPAAVFAAFSALLIVEFRRRGTADPRSGGPLLRLVRHLDAADLLVLIFGAAAVGLTLMPEFVYVRDIYEQSHARANTMFKLTYQAFLLFALVMSYAAVRFLLKKRRALRAAGIAVAAFLVLTAGYFGRGAADWFGVKSAAAFFGAGSSAPEWKGIDSEIFLEDRYPSDAGAVNYLLGVASAVPLSDRTPERLPVVLEADGDSYGKTGRVSVITGLPTVLGWHTHEWLWRSDWDLVAERSEDVQTIYTSGDEETIRDLVDKYRISYIYVGEVEREEFPEIDEETLCRMYPAVYADESGTYILATEYAGYAG